ncbi:MAG TPA: cytochrome c biogenesis protein ResB [Myxococcota bacterium]|nr:cytochrome c biogenesis protein ResB [Myxococcota bacterium]HRY95401.1 cytochrome c biogenesis protein ResB [Myxococcota bacterium]
MADEASAAAGIEGSGNAERPGLARGFVLLAAGFLAGTLLQHLLELLLGGPAAARAWVVPGGLLCFVLAVAAGLHPRAHGLLASNRFSVPVLLWLTALAALGTVILQGLDPAQVHEVYGWAARLILGLYLHEVFQSLGFAVVLGLGAAGLALTIARRKPLTWRRAGAVLAHLGILLILAGAAAGALWGAKGRLNLREGQVAEHFTVQRDGRAQRLPLGFQLRLDDFRLLEYDPQWRLMVFAVHGEREERLLSVDPADPREAAALREYGLELLRHLPEGLPAAAAPAPAGPAHVLVVGAARLPVEPGQTYELPEGAGRLQVLRAFHDFVIDAATRQPQNRSPRPDNPALEVALLDAQGREQKRTWLFAKFPAFQHQAEAGAGGPAPVSIQYVFTPPAGAAPAEGPVVELRLGGLREPTRLGPRQPIRLGGDRVLVLAPRGGDMVRDYLSDVSVLEGGQLRLQQTVEVNHPLEHGGLAIYQSDYRPEDLAFSGFQVVRDPGLPAVYLGFGLNLVGVLLVVFFPRGLPWRRRAAAGESATGAAGGAA